MSKSCFYHGDDVNIIERLRQSAIFCWGEVEESGLDSFHLFVAADEFPRFFCQMETSIGAISGYAESENSLNHQYNHAEFFSEISDKKWPLGNEWTVPYVLEGFGDIALAENHAPRAVRLYGAAAVVRERLGLTLAPSDRVMHEQAVARMHAALPPEEFAQAWEAGRGTPIDEALSQALGKSA